MSKPWHAASVDEVLKELNVKENDDLHLLLKASTLCANAQYDGKSIIGDTTEGALIVAAAKAGMVKENLEKEYPRIREMPFTSERKRMTTVHNSSEGKLFAYVKGAPEVVLERCTHVINEGKIGKLTENKRREILEINEKMASDALRVLGVAFKEFTSLSTERLDDNLESGLTFIGLIGMSARANSLARRSVGMGCCNSGFAVRLIYTSRDLLRKKNMALGLTQHSFLLRLLDDKNLRRCQLFNCDSSSL